MDRRASSSPVGLAYGLGAYLWWGLVPIYFKAVAHIPNLQQLMRFVCDNGFEHHVVMSGSHCAGVLVEAFENYLGWDVYYHAAPEE